MITYVFMVDVMVLYEGLMAILRPEGISEPPTLSMRRPGEGGEAQSSG